MDLITGGAALPSHLRGGIVALGNFDGFHAGHQAVVGAARDWARKLGRPALVASFDPHPARLFQPDVPPFSLSTISQRGEWLGQFGMDGAVVMPFNRALAALSAEEFVSEWLVTRLGVAGVVTMALPGGWSMRCRTARARSARPGCVPCCVMRGRGWRRSC
ncbi:hypothetical protein [Sandarakinorhabdus sp.]|uniref:hypothetical protein n=1 Tax=Sandarakinorhabdus sp. TaxID=1916663 RepID=UPI00391834A9